MILKSCMYAVATALVVAIVRHWETCKSHMFSGIDSIGVFTPRRGKSLFLNRVAMIHNPNHGEQGLHHPMTTKSLHAREFQAKYAFPFQYASSLLSKPLIGPVELINMMRAIPWRYSKVLNGHRA